MRFSQKVKGALLVFIFLVYFFVKAESINRIIARVNQEVITSQDLENYCKVLKYKNPQIKIDEEFKKKILDTLIENKLILSLAKKENVHVPPRWVKKEIERISSFYSSFGEFSKNLAKEGLSLASLKKRLEEEYLIRLMIDKYVRSKLNITPYEITQFYYHNKKRFTKPAEYIIWIGKWKSEEEALLVYESLKKSDNWGKNLQRIRVEKDRLKEEIKKVVDNLKEKEMVMKEIGEYFYIVYLEKKIPSMISSLEEVKEEIYSLLEEKKFTELFKKWIEKLKGEALIKIYE